MTSTGGGPTGLGARALAPDLARGFMLLFIALANSHYFLRGDAILGGFPTDGSRLDSAVAGLIVTFVDGRAFPMFGFLFGYGVVQIARRQTESGTPWRSVRWLLWRRSLFLVVLGFLHAMLLYVGDILAAYGVLLFLGVWALRWKDTALLIVAGLFLALSAFPVTTRSRPAWTAPTSRCCPRTCSPPSRSGSQSSRSSCSWDRSGSPARSCSRYCWRSGSGGSVTAGRSRY